ncbi:MAG: M48 family metallopeptidase [Akkermansiaceae bacterium]|jgi:predicted Zn-dependent protease|tara:strand:- start:279 stop:1061 length:783 start_codon:yes stop_codon:yes gene_type:complete
MKKHLQRLLTNKGVTLLLPIAVLGCAAPAAYNANTGQVAVRPASTTLIQQGEAAFAQYKSKTPVSQNSKARARAYRVANKLRPVINLPGARWEFEVFEDSSVNAFALPGGKVGINTGLLNIAVTDGQLAAALAHEMAHVTSNHAQARIQNNQMITLGSALLGAVLGGVEGGQQLEEIAQKGGQIAFGLTFSRTQELEADRVGTIFMARAGYDPAEAITLWERMGAQSRSTTPEFLSTHPVSATRIQKLREFLPAARAQQR